MTFPEAMAAAIGGGMVRREAWSLRRAIRLTVAPWNGEEERLLLVDRLNRGDVQPFPYHPTGPDMRGDDWTAC